jgi:ferrochelatase
MARDLPPVRRLAVVLFNLGGPDKLKAVQPFLFNLFSDPAIIGAPALVRYPLAGLFSKLRKRSAQDNYRRMGGASPLLPETRAQAEALKLVLSRQNPGATVGVFVAMRYWSPFTAEAARQVATFEPDDVVLTPLYPQYSTTTTGSSMTEWTRRYPGPGRVHALCCYPLLEGFVEAHADRIRTTWINAGGPKGVRLLFSAHGLPQKVVNAGDPYASQIEASAAAVAARVADILPDWAISYQSRVGPMKWLGPATPDAVKSAAAEGLGVLITPIAFVSEHIETLVELDHDYAVLAANVGCRPYLRAPALGVHPAFMEDLARLIGTAALATPGTTPGSQFRCGECWSKCPRAGVTRAA